jgi:hypothetical protein
LLAAGRRLTELVRCHPGTCPSSARAETALVGNLEAAGCALRAMEPRRHKMAIVPVRTPARPPSTSAE